MTLYSNDPRLPDIFEEGRNDRVGLWSGLAAGAFLAVVLAVSIGAALGQTPSNAGPGFRDPATGRVYTPDNVGKDGVPVAPQDRAFDPRSQQTSAPLRSTFQSPQWQAVGPAPVTAGYGSGVPIMTFEAASLQPQTPGRWVLDLVVANNSATTISPAIECAFSNGSHVVEFVAVRLYAIPPGQRVQASIYGPESDRMYVDNAPCTAITQ